MRLKSSLKNMYWGLFGQAVSIILSFIVRTFFIKKLGAEYLGIDGLFTNILSILSLANLGFDSAVIFSLYRPLKDNNITKIKGYMVLYSKIYKFVGIFIFIIGIIIIPFIPYIINSNVNIKESLSLIYLLFLLSSSLSYLYVYKQSLLIANQKSYLVSRIHIFFIIISNFSQIILLLIIKKYIIILIIQLIFKLSENIYISIYVDKIFPFLNDKSIEGSLSIKEKKSLYKSVYSMLLYKISGTVINSTDNIIISYYLGIFYVGIYSNYLLIMSTVSTLLSYVFSSLTASIGNLLVSDELEKKEFVFYEIFFVSFWIYGVSSIMLYLLLNKFISLWIGDYYMLDNFTIFIIVLNYYTTGMQAASTAYRTTSGLFNVGRYRPIIAALINLIVSVLLAPKLKIAGILMGTIISRLCVYFWFDPLIIHKHIFGKSSKYYFIEYIKRFFLIFIIGFFTKLNLDILAINDLYIKFLYDCCISFILPNIMFFLLYKKNKYFSYIKSIIINIKDKKLYSN